jgi:hypothetical protein
MDASDVRFWLLAGVLAAVALFVVATERASRRERRRLEAS